MSRTNSVYLSKNKIEKRMTELGYTGRDSLMALIEQQGDGSADFVRVAWRGKPVREEKANLLANALKLNDFRTLRIGSGWEEIFDHELTGREATISITTEQQDAKSHFYPLEHAPGERIKISNRDKWRIEVETGGDDYLFLFMSNDSEQAICVPGPAGHLFKSVQGKLYFPTPTKEQLRSYLPLNKGVRGPLDFYLFYATHSFFDEQKYLNARSINISREELDQIAFDFIYSNELKERGCAKLLTDVTEASDE